MALTSIGRFKVGKKLGAGNQGTVYLCGDTELQRRVAIKLLDKTVIGSETVRDAFRREARTMSKIQHPNIVSIYEAGWHQGVPYLVFEYVEGRLLSDLISHSALDINGALDVFQGMLEGMERAHGQGIVHCDLKPSNVIINGEKIPKIMDFGIARMLSGSMAQDAKLIGSPRYMAPESIREGRIGTQSDVFALGLILHELLTGRPVFTGKNQQEVLDNIVEQPVAAPSHSNGAIDERLDRLALKAMDKSPDARFSHAGDLLSALKEYRRSRRGDVEQGPDRDTQATIDFLHRRMQRQSDFPALSRSIRTLNGMAAASDKDVNDMAQVIVKDYALTNKILKVVNSAYYGHFAGNIGTISRAVVVLGMQPIRSLAASLIFFEHLHNQAQADSLRSQVSAALFSAVFASRLSTELDAEQREENFLCAMLHNLGKMLVTYYLHEESCEIERVVDQEHIPQAQAERKVLGTTFEQIGTGIARHWNFPLLIRNTMKPLPPDQKAKAACNGAEQRRLLACFANEAAALVGAQGLDDQQAVNGLMQRYHAALSIKPQQFREMMDDSVKEFLSLVVELSKPGATDGFIGKLSKSEPGGGTVDQQRAVNPTAATQLPGAAATGIDAGQASMAQPNPANDPEVLLTNGLQEVTGILVGEHDLNQVLNVVLETMYRAMACERVVLCLQDSVNQRMTARLGFGQGVDAFIKKFQFPMSYAPDVFHAVIKNSVDVYIQDTHAENIRNDLPAWYKEVSSARCFLAFPLVVAKRTLGIIYADHLQPDGMQITGKSLNLLKALRNQIILAFRERAG